MDNVLPVLILLGRPAAGKSELIDYLGRTPQDERARRFHVGPFQVIDDFPLLWTWFEEDALLHDMGRPRLHTTGDGHFRRRYLWDLLVRRLGQQYDKWRRDAPLGSTAIIEFSRGSEHGGYRGALPCLTESVLRDAAILYIRVSWEESLRKNRARCNPQRPDSILEHSLSDANLRRLYKEADWDELASADSSFLTVRGHKVPYAVFENEDDVTTPRGDALGGRLESTLGRLWELWSAR